MKPSERIAQIEQEIRQTVSRSGHTIISGYDPEKVTEIAILRYLDEEYKKREKG